MSNWKKSFKASVIQYYSFGMKYSDVKLYLNVNVRDTYSLLVLEFSLMLMTWWSRLGFRFCLYKSDQSGTIKHWGTDSCNYFKSRVLKSELIFWGCLEGSVLLP